LYGALTIAFAYPLSIHPASRVLPVGADANLYLWTLQWDVHALTHRPLSIFDANIYYPYRHTLAYSENLIGSALIAAPFLWTTASAIVALNAVALLSCVLCGVGTYLLARRVGIGPRGALAAGLIFAFAPPRFFRLGQLHLTTVQWIPFCLAFLHAYFDFGRRADLWWAAAFFMLQVVTSAHGAVFCTLSVGGLLVWRAVLGGWRIRAARGRDVVLAAACAAAVALFVFLPYRAVQNEMGLRRSLEETTYFSPNLTSFLASPSRLHMWLASRFTGEPIPSDASAFLFPGYLTLILAAAGVWTARSGDAAARRAAWSKRASRLCELAIVVTAIVALALTITGGGRVRHGSTVMFSARSPWRAWIALGVLLLVRAALSRSVPLDARHRLRAAAPSFARWAGRARDNHVLFYSMLAIVGFWLALGIPYGLYRLVYAWPGLSFIRVPSRFSIVGLMALAIVAGAGFDRFAARFRERTRTVLTIVTLVVLAAEFFAAPLQTAPYAVDVPAIDRWLATRPTPFVVAEVPLASPIDVVAAARRQSTYMLHSTAHWQKTIHGYSGMQPPLHDVLYLELRTFPDERSLTHLSSIGVTDVVVHTELYSPDEWRRVSAALDRFSDRLPLEHTEGAGRVYSLRDWYNPAR